MSTFREHLVKEFYLPPGQFPPFRPGVIYLEPTDSLICQTTDAPAIPVSVPGSNNRLDLLRHPTEGNVVGFLIHGVRGGIPLESFTQLLRIGEVRELLGI